MIKPDLLRQHLTAALPDLKRNPDRLHIFIDQGQILCRQTGNISFEYRYRLHVLLTDFAGSPDQIMVPVLAWLALNQPELLRQRNSEAFTFEAEILDNKRADVSIELALSEVVVVEPADGGYTVSHPPEPQDNPLFEGVLDTARLWTLVLGSETIFDVAP